MLMARIHSESAVQIMPEFRLIKTLCILSGRPEVLSIHGILYYSCLKIPTLVQIRHHVES